jgi:hypothetical protein
VGPAMGSALHSAVSGPRAAARHMDRRLHGSYALPARLCAAMPVIDSPGAAPSPLEPLEHHLHSAREAAFVLFADKAAGDGPVVCAIDATPAARRAARTAKALSQAFSTDLIMAHVDQSPLSDRTAAAARDRRRALEQVAANARRVTGDGDFTALDGDRTRVQRLLAFARDSGARVLITTAADGGAEPWLRTGVVSPCPVVVLAGYRRDPM